MSAIMANCTHGKEDPERATLPFSALWQPAYRPLLQLMTMIAAMMDRAAAFCMV